MESSADKIELVEDWTGIQMKEMKNWKVGEEGEEAKLNLRLDPRQEPRQEEAADKSAKRGMTILDLSALLDNDF